jgi:sugar phosphate isomerase/epimerase
VRGSTITLQEYPLEESLRIFRAAGFDSLELWKGHLGRARTPELRTKVAAFAAESGITMGGFNAVGEDYYQPFGDDRAREATLEGLKADTEIALALGTSDVLIWEGVAPKSTTEQQWLDRLLPQLVEFLECAIAYGKPKGVRYLVEPHPFTVGMSDRFLIALCDALDPEHFGVTFDFCHYGVGRRNDYLAAIHNLGHRIKHIHFSDSDQQTSELHFPPGTGRMNLEAMLQAFKKIRYRGTITLDLYGYPLPVQALASSAAQLRKAAEFLNLVG